MAQFKVGDRVRYTGKSTVTSSPKMIGKTGVVDNPKSTPWGSVKVLWDGPVDTDFPTGVMEENLELIEEEPAMISYDARFQPLLDAAIAVASALREENALRNEANLATRRCTAASDAFNDEAQKASYL